MKKNLLILLSLVMGMLFAFPQPSWALVLFERPANGDTTIYDNEPISYSGIWYYGLLYSPGPRAFDLTLTPANAGDVFTFGPADSEFASFVNYLTNGTDDTIREEFKYPGPTGQIGSNHTSPESLFLGSSSYSSNGIDLAGNTIHSLQFYIDELSTSNELDNSGSYEGHIRYNARLVVNGEPGVIPEPATMFLFGTGLVGFIWKRRKS